MVKKLITKALILFILCLGLPAQAQFNIDSISVSEVANGSAKVRWHTSEISRGLIYYGTKANALNTTIDNPVKDDWHDSTITGLKKQTKYYYKIVAINAEGQRSESFIQNFETGEMAEAVINPNTVNINIKQVTHDALAINWITDIPTIANIYYYYGDDSNQNRQATRTDQYITNHYLYIYGLVPNQHYYIVIDAESESKGHKTASAAFATASKPSNAWQLKVSQLQPLSLESDRITAQEITISWETNLVAKSNIYYGTQTGNLNQVLSVNKQPEINHQITLRQLTPNTVYYYRLEMPNALYDQSLLTEEKTFTTKALKPGQSVLGEKITSTQAAGFLDSDGDGLSDGQEQIYGTDPKSADSDKDGFNDQLEIKNNFNPLGYGRTILQISRALNNQKGTESKKAKQLISWLPYQKSLPSNWAVLVNAYVFGGYPVEDIRLAAKGKANIVHTSIPWQIWKNSTTYQAAKK